MDNGLVGERPLLRYAAVAGGMHVCAAETYPDDRYGQKSTKDYDADANYFYGDDVIVTIGNGYLHVDQYYSIYFATAVVEP